MPATAKLALPPTPDLASARRAASAPADEAAQASAAMAHDFNNLLTVMMSASEALTEAAAPGTEQHELARVCLEAAERGTELLAKMVALAGQPESAAEAVDGAEVVETTLRFVRRTLPKRVELWSCVDSPVVCLADKAGLERALLNLCLNAGEAMPDGGVVALDAREALLGPLVAANLGLSPGLYVKFTVRDTGVGMSPATLARAQEPYFTTKAASGGSGLGLASVRAFAAGCGGALSLASREGDGVTAAIYLPAAAA
jgi:signal transduction histidine kinase